MAVARSGRVIDERTLRPREALRAGPSERDTVLLASNELASSVELIRWTSSGYVLCVPPTASGLVADTSDSSAVEVDPLAPPRKLARGGRGRIRVGETTILFHLIEAPLARPRPTLAPGLKQGLAIDWPTTVIAAFSFLFHFGLVGSIYSDWLDPLVDDHLVVGRVIEAIASLPVAPPVESHEDSSAKTVAAATPRAPTATKGTAGPAGRAPARAAGMSEARADALLREMQALDVAVAATLQAGGAKTDEVLSRDVGMPDVEGAAAENRASGPGSMLHLGRAELGSPRSQDLRDLAHVDGGGPADGGQATQPKRAPGANVSTNVASSGTVTDAMKVVAGLQGRYHRCYQKGLSTEDASMRGSMRITVKVAPNGEVAGVTATSGGSLSGTVVSCVQSATAGAHFQPPEGGLGATLVIPAGFEPQP